MTKSLQTYFFAVALVALSVFPALARQPESPIPVWPGVAPGEKGDIPDELVQPPKGDNITRITNVSKPTITLYRAPAETNTGTAVVVCPGGGYNILAYNHEGSEVCEWLNTLGVNAVLLKYRVPARKGQARHTAPLQDAQRALGIVRQRAAEWGIQPDRIGILGFSAGGHLSAVASNTYEQRTYEPIDDADKVSCRPDFTLLIYPAYLTVAKEGDKVAPELKVTEKTAPTFLLMTQDDGVRVESAVFYYMALKQAKVPAEMHLYPSGGHGYGLRPSKHAVSTWPQRAEQWMRTLGLLEAKK